VAKRKKPTTPPRTPAKRASGLPAGYADLLAGLKARIRSAQLKAAVAVNRELVTLYWQIGREILARQRAEGWGAKVIDRLGRDLQAEFPGVAGFSPRNLKYMRAFAAAWPEEAFVQQAAAQIPWFHHCLLLDRVKDPGARGWYIRQVVEHGWSRAVLDHHIDTGLFARQGKAVTNFDKALPPARSDLAREVLKDPYTFDFLTLADEHQERDLERELLAHIRRFLLELGAGFAFVGQQVPIEVGGEDFTIDLLFYHLRLRCYVVIDLKAVPFKPEFAGKMNFYLSAVDDRMRHPDDQPSIGIVLCKSRNEVVAEYALRDLNKPVGVASYVTRIVESLPAALRGQLPDPKQLKAALEEAGESAGPG
jgi:predicted nuclease of restriction endonuclease-like (RecB) superfamily